MLVSSMQATSGVLYGAIACMGYIQFACALSNLESHVVIVVSCRV